MLLFVVFNLNQFAHRSTCPGSMYAYTGRGLGAVGGVLSRWTLIWSYLFIGVAGMTGFTIFSRQFLDIAGIHASIPAFVFFAISAALCWTLAVKDIRLSSMLTLILEAISVLCILALAAIVLFKHGIAVDSDQVNLTGVTFSGMSFAVVACIFSLVGFESATALGGEARNALQTIPKAVIWSLILTGLFFVFMGYVEVFGTRGQHDTLDTLATPLNTLAGLRLRRHAGRVRIPPKPTSRHRGRYGEDGHLRLGLAGCPRVPRALSPSLCGVRLWTAPGRRQDGAQERGRRTGGSGRVERMAMTGASAVPPARRASAR